MCRKLNVLLAFANPEESERLALGAEHDAIQEAIKRGRCRDGIFVKSIQAMTVDSLRQALLEGDYQIVHFGGHGTIEGEAVAETRDGDRHPIPAKALADLFRGHTTLECVVLNECFSAAGAELIAAGVPVVVGMREAIIDADGLKFAEGFFDAIGAGRDPEVAFGEGVLAVRLASPETNFNPVLLKGPGSAAAEELSLVLRTQHKDHTLRIRPQGEVRRLLDQAKCVTVVKEEAVAGFSARIPLKWALIDVRLENFWQQLQGDQQAYTSLLAETASGPVSTDNGSARLQDLGIENGTTFRLYPVPIRGPKDKITPEAKDFEF